MKYKVEFTDQARAEAEFAFKWLEKSAPVREIPLALFDRRAKSLSPARTSWRTNSSCSKTPGKLQRRRRERILWSADDSSAGATGRHKFLGR